jgi:tetratricopeptide (TPR) repeat protein
MPIVPFLLAMAMGSAAGSRADLSVLDDAALGGHHRYDRCLALTRRDPQLALSAAKSWEVSAGGSPATHCAAVALVALKRYPEAARQLDRLGHANLGSALERAEIFDQAGNAWLLASRGGEATASFSSALALSPNDPDLLADRARAAAFLRDWKAADLDLSSALKLDASRADLLILRASARHAFGRKAEARTDVEAALRILPNYPEALLERGTLKLETGDTKGARADWEAVVATGGGSAAAETAQQRLNTLARPKAK